MIDQLENLILLLARMGTLIMALIIFANLVGDLRNTYFDEHKNGLWATRLTMVILMGALILENLVYAVGYFHSELNTIRLNQWLTLAKPLVIISRVGLLVAVFYLYRLFCCNGKKKE